MNLNRLQATAPPGIVWRAFGDLETGQWFLLAGDNVPLVKVSRRDAELHARKCEAACVQYGHTVRVPRDENVLLIEPVHPQRFRLPDSEE